MTKLQKLCLEIKDNETAFIITSDINRRYLLDFNSSAGALLVIKDKAYFIVDFRYIEIAQKRVKDADVVLQEKLYEQINEILNRHSIKRVVFESKSVTVSQYSAYVQKINAQIDTSDELSDIIQNMRSIKTQDEIEKIRKAQQISEKAYNELLNYIKVGISEKDIATRLDILMREYGSECESFTTIALAGANTSLPHGHPSDYKVKSGDFVLLDFGSVYDGYHSDMTRTFALEHITDEQAKVYETVFKAQALALDSIKSGESCAKIDKIARDYIYAQGYEGMFGHGLGHSVGLEIHENPSFSPSCEKMAKSNMVITVEPGIYIPGKFGVRIEDMVVVTDLGYQNLTSAQKNLLII
ncbi:MAG: aminopeptidase P family protein [Oscillospiraceae bacterium]|nr:aminopeptidase P family protein [Oscillospiraceae bacterium]